MPELPEVETVRAGLAKSLDGARIYKVQLMRPNLRLPFPDGFAQTLENKRILGFRRRAKYILADLEGDMVWMSHLGMSGSFRVSKDAQIKHDHVIMDFEDGQRLTFNDPRRFGFMDVFGAKDEDKHPYLAHLGVEPLSNHFNGARILEAFKGRKTAVKQALMDQKLIVGVGNIYASESLYMAGIHPEREAGSLKKVEAERLAVSVVDVLRAALVSGGSTLRDHKQLDGNTGYFQHHFNVYGKKGQDCPCGTGKIHSIQSLTQGGRTTFYCPVKQR